MNIYNENLHSGVVASLQTQTLVQKKLKAKKDASMFTLYYAEGAEIFAGEKLAETKLDYEGKQAIHSANVTSSNVSQNVLMLSGKQKQYTDTTVTGAGIMAANVQFASNAVVKLSSDIGSILSILSASNSGTTLYKECKDAHALISETAYDAQQASQHAMEASAKIAEIASASIASQAKATNDAINGLLTTTASDLAATGDVFEAELAASAAANVNTKLAEDKFEYNNVEYKASKKVARMNKRLLNLNLTAKGTKTIQQGFTVAFDFYQCPFSGSDINFKLINPAVLQSPVESYNILVVKESKQNTFSMSNAESMMTNPNQFFHIPSPLPLQDPPSKASSASAPPSSTAAPAIGSSSAAPPAVALPAVTATGKGMEVTLAINSIMDSDNEPILPGQNYAVFVLVQLTADYKNAISTFDDYLTAGSDPFTITYKLQEAINVNVTPFVPAPPSSTAPTSATPPPVYQGAFNVTETYNFLQGDGVEYRCMLVPIPLGKLVELVEIEEGLHAADEEKKYALLQKDYDKLSSELSGLMTLKTPNNAEKKKIEALQQKVTDLSAKLKLRPLPILQPTTKQLVPENDEVFFFKLKLAENVTAGNFTLTDQTPTPGTSGAGTSSQTKYTFSIIEETATDNFGRPLISGMYYIPVVLSFFNGKEVDQSQFLNSLSDWKHTPAFLYNPTN